MNKYKPTCEQQIVKKAKLTHLAFSPSQPILLVGDDHGHVACLKLSPNLRKSGDSADDQSSRLAEVLKIGTVDLF
jgi:dynein intermediate chain 1